MNPLITFIVPAYRVETYIHQCLKSILAIKKYPIEVIVLDEGDEDENWRNICELAKEDKRLITPHRSFGGYGAAVNYAIKLSKGKYFCIVEGDDYIIPENLVYLMDQVKDEPFDFVKAPFYVVEEKGLQEICPVDISFCKSVPLMEAKKELLASFASIWSCLYSTNFVKNKIRFVEEKGGGYVDNVFRFDTVNNARSIHFIDIPFYCYRLNRENSTTALYDVKKMMKRWQEIHMRVLPNSIFCSSLLVEEYLSTLHRVLLQKLDPSSLNALINNFAFYNISTVFKAKKLTVSQKVRIIVFKLFPNFFFSFAQFIVSLQSIVRKI